MSLPQIFSRRKRNAAKAGVDVYQYDDISNKFRVQFCQILQSAIGSASQIGYSYPPGRKVFSDIRDLVRKEEGVFILPPSGGDEDPDDEFFNWFLQLSDTDIILDCIEIGFAAIDKSVRSNRHAFREYISISQDAAIAELNGRLREAGVGYQYESGQLIRVDSGFAHAEIIIPALSLLQHRRFSNAEREYLAAHAAYRANDFETCLLECGKSFESVLKVIGAKRGWAGTNDTATRLIDAAYAADFIPTAMQAEFTALRSLLTAGVPVLRNKLAGHGAGTATRIVPEHFAAFQLHQTAAVILFLARQDEALG
jgi:hypothetical protein